jgi:succinyl-CoA--D-citramalate CoA-transferase
MANMSAPLAGNRVVEIGSFVAGPFCGQLLGDLGAEVIKVEDPAAGDPMRRWGRSVGEGSSLWWSVLARNKRSVTINLRHSEGQATVRKLIETADILLENFRPGTIERWGLDPEDLIAENPGLVVVRISGYGQTGPYRDRAGFGSVAEAMGGLRYLVGFPDRPPPRLGVAIGDALAGTFGTLGALAALLVRAKDGRGQIVDVAIYEAVMAMMESVISESALTGSVRGPTGTVLPGVAPSNIYPTADGSWVVIGGNADTVFGRLAATMGKPELATDPRFATHEARGRHQAEIDDLVAQWTSTFERGALVDLLAEKGVPAGPIYTAADILADRHIRAREMIVEPEDPVAGPVPMQGVVPRLSRTPGRVDHPGPLLGEHTAAILEEVGIDASMQEKLRSEGVI